MCNEKFFCCICIDKKYLFISSIYYILNVGTNNNSCRIRNLNNIETFHLIGLSNALDDHYY